MDKCVGDVEIRFKNNLGFHTNSEIDDYDLVYKILLSEVIHDNVYFKDQNLCKHFVMNGYCVMRHTCRYDHPKDLTGFFTGPPRSSNKQGPWGKRMRLK